MGPSLGSGDHTELLSKTLRSYLLHRFLKKDQTLLLERCGPCVPEKAGTAEGETVTAYAKSRHLACQRHYYCQCGPTRDSRVPTWTPWTTDTPDLGSPSMVLLSSQSSLQLLLAWCRCTTHHPEWVLKGLHDVLGFFLCNRQWSLSTFLSSRFLQGQTKATTSNHDHATMSGRSSGSTTGRTYFLK